MYIISIDLFLLPHYTERRSGVGAIKMMDPNGDRLSFRWLQYREPGTNDWNVAGKVPALNVTTSQGGRLAQVQVPAEKESCNGEGFSPSGCWLLHLILEVTDDGYHPLTSYRRVLLQTTNSTEAML